MAGIFKTLRSILRPAERTPKEPDPPRHSQRNAPLDPRGRKYATAGDLTGVFNILRADYVATTQGALPVYEELKSSVPGAWFKPEEPPLAIIFVSHRWETPDLPDPCGVQAAAIRAFLTAARNIADTMGQGEAERASHLPSLLVHGAFQAGYFLENSIAFGARTTLDWSQLASEYPKTAAAPQGILCRIGLWYDFACLEQENRQSERLIQSLRSLQELIGEATMLILRSPGDQYETRAWCAAEISIEPDIDRHQCKRIVLRIDKTGDAFPLSTIIDSPQKYNDGSRRILAQPIAEWIKNGRRAVIRISELYDMFLGELEDERDVPLFTPRSKPVIFSGQRELLIHAMQDLGSLSKIDQSEPSGAGLRVDVADLVGRAVRAGGLQSTNAKDLLYSGFLILYARHRGAPEMAGFYGVCLQRWLDGRSTTLLRYREKREPYDIRVWFIFDDEPVGSQAWQIPSWARVH